MKAIKLLYILLLSIPLCIKAESDKYRLILTANPATTITIAWNQVSGTNQTVRYGTVDQGQNANDYQLTHTPDKIDSFRGMNNNFARLTGLLPNTYYYFVIQDSNSISQRFYFKTAPDDRSRLSFIAGGDSRNNREPRIKANKLVSKIKPNAVFFGGDMTSLDFGYQWEQWFDDWQYTTAADGRMFPIIPARGNHERSETIYRLFDTVREESYGAITFGDDFFRVYTLNTEASVFGDQKNWLEQDLQQHSSTLYRAAQYHKPMRPHTSDKSEGNEIYNAWANLFYENAVKLVVDSDSHTVKTTKPVKPSTGVNSEEGFEVDTERGTVYTGEGCWGAPLRPANDNKDWTRDSGSFNQFKIIFVDEEKIELRTINVDNADSVSEGSNENPFQLPSNLNVWTMSDGEQVVYIYPSQAITAPKIKFSETMPSSYQDKNNIQVTVNVLEEGSGISNITYSARSLRTGNTFDLGTTTTEPHAITVTFPEDGQYELTARATGTDDLYHEVFKVINVGYFEGSSTLSIISGSNDIEEGQGNNGKIYMNSSDLELGYDSYSSQNYQKVGLRFEDVLIPQGATVTSARIMFKADQGGSNNAQSTIYLEDNTNSSYFESTDYNLTQRSFLQENVVWDIAPWTINDQGENTTTPELKALLQTIVNKNDWQQGNAMTFMFTPSGPSLENTANMREAESFDGDASGAPQLIYTYSFGEDGSSNGTGIVQPGVGINTSEPATPLDVNGLMRSSARDEEGNLYECSEEIEGAMGYDKAENTIKVCFEVNGEFIWKTIKVE